MRAASATLAIVFTLIALSAASAQEARVRIDGLAAIAGALAPGPQAVTVLHSDVTLRARLALLGAGVERAAVAPLPSGLLRATLEELLGEALILAEVRRLDLATPEAARVMSERQRFVTKSGGATRVSTLLRELGASERELTQIVVRRATVRAFLDAKLEGAAEVTQAEIERAYASDEQPFRDRPLEEVREMLRVWLIQRRIEGSVSRWVQALKQRMPYRVLMEY